MSQDVEIKTEAGSNKFRLFMFFPLVLLVAAFMLDKQLFIWRFPEYFLRTASFVSYEQKEDMQTQLQYYLLTPNRKKVVVMFGNSRTTTFDNQYIEDKYPDHTLFNFSVPGGTADYYLYRLQEFEKHQIKPDFIYFALTPQGLNATPSIAMDEVMLEGLPISFVVKHFYNYKPTHLTNLLAKKMFWTYQYRPKLNVVLDRLRNDSRYRRIFRNFLASERANLDKNRGSVFIHGVSKPVQDDDFLKKSAEGTWRDFLTPFTVDQGQLDFVQKTLAITQRMKIRNAILWMKVGPNLRHLKATRNIAKKGEARQTLKEHFIPLMQGYTKEYNSQFIDMNFGDTIKCDLFNDSSHMAGYCFHELSDFLMSRVLE